VEDQVRECKAWAEANGFVVADDLFFVDRGKSGRTDRRPCYMSMLQHVDDFDVLVVLEPSRLYRKLYKTLQFIAEEIIDLDKRLVFVAQDLDTGKDDRWKFLVPIMGCSTNCGPWRATPTSRRHIRGCMPKDWRGALGRSATTAFRSKAGRPRRANRDGSGKFSKKRRVGSDRFSTGLSTTTCR
jgi:hypothetical protein